MLIEGPQDSTPAVLLEESATEFTIFDGASREKLAKVGRGGDAGAAPRVEPASAAQVVKLLTAARATETDDVLRALYFGRVMAQRGEDGACEALLRTIDDDAASIGAAAARAKGARLASDAVTAYANGEERAHVAGRLQLAATMQGPGAAYATALLPTLMALEEPAATASEDALGELIRTRVRALGEQTCPATHGDPQRPGSDPAGRVRALGFTALPELARTFRDGRPSRCLAADPAGAARDAPTPRLETIGAIARAVSAAISGNRPHDAYDVECSNDGADPQAVALVDAAIARADVPGAITITRGAQGRLRVAMVERLANAAGAAAKEFVKAEAESGPVLLARVEAARVQGARGDVTWAESLAPFVASAIAQDDATEPGRCGAGELSRQGLSLLLRFAPGAALDVTASAFDGLGPRARVHVASELGALVAKTAANAKARDAILLRALQDARPAAGTTVVVFGAPCVDPTPAEVAASALGRRVGAPFSCALAPAARASAIAAISAKIAGKP
jgi:hypothetical protein